MGYNFHILMNQLIFCHRAFASLLGAHTPRRSIKQTYQYGALTLKPFKNWLIQILRPNDYTVVRKIDVHQKSTKIISRTKNTLFMNQLAELYR